MRGSVGELIWNNVALRFSITSWLGMKILFLDFFMLKKQHTNAGKATATAKRENKKKTCFQERNGTK